VPTLLVRMTDSDMVAQADAAALRNHVPHAELLDVAGGGHRFTGPQRELLAERLARFALAT
jgi:pimeloyl-ACP methyl ester carboxylesterase